MTPAKVKIAAWEWTPWPTWPLPDEAMLAAWADTHGLAWIHEFHARRERNILNEIHNPYAYGWESPVVKAARALLAGEYVPGKFGGGPSGPALPRATELLLMTGNRFGKSEFGGRLVNEVLMTTPAARVRCWSQSLETSRSVQQRSVFKYLHPDLRKIKRQGQFTKISYSAATGFTEETFLFPTGRGTDFNQCWFQTYHSWMNDKTIAEGFEADLIWCDEETPAELLDTLRLRTGMKRMVLLVTFTPVSGYTEAAGQFIEGARIVETVPARAIEYDWWERTWKWGAWLLPQDKELVPGCPPGHVPFLLEHTQVPGRYALCAATAWNPYITVQDVIDKVSSRTQEEKLIRLFGWPSRKVRPALSFADAHIVPAENVPPLNELTIYLAVDPCPPPRNWFMLWVGVDREDRMWVLAEWPDMEVGEWAVPGSEPDGKPGPGAYDGGCSGFGDYQMLILSREGWVPDAAGVLKPGPGAITVLKRLLDPRAAAWQVPSIGNDPEDYQDNSSARTYVDFLREPVTRRREGKVIEITPGLDFFAAPSEEIDQGNELINGWLTDGWDTTAPLTPMNAPKFYVNAGEKNTGGDKGSKVPGFLRVGCANTIWALRTFTGRKRSGAVDRKGACKDPIDCVKMLVKGGIAHVPVTRHEAYGGGAY
jgi:hypothetical protein